VDGPLKLTGVSRQSLPVRWIVLTKFSVKIPYGCNAKCLAKALESNKIVEEWNKTAWAKRIEMRKKRANMTDFERFKLRMAKKLMSNVVRVKYAGLRKAHNKQQAQKK